MTGLCSEIKERRQVVRFCLLVKRRCRGTEDDYSCVNILSSDYQAVIRFISGMGCANRENEIMGIYFLGRPLHIARDKR